MKLTKELKERIDKYFEQISADELYSILIKYGITDDNSMKHSDVHPGKMTGEWFKHIRRKWRRILNKKRRSFLKYHQNKELYQ